MNATNIRQGFKNIADHFIVVRRENLRTLARLKAVETLVFEFIPADKRASWQDSVDRLTNSILQELLEEFEKESPSYAALLDDRGPDELRGIE